MSVTGTRELVDEATWSHKQATGSKGSFTSNRTHATTKNTPFSLPETDTKATANEVRDLSWAEKKGGKIRPVGTISREVMRAFPRQKISLTFPAAIRKPRA